MANSNLVANLNSIYATKLEIKEVLNTESDDFTKYPDLIKAAIASGGASGYAYITENGNHDIATYAYVNVNVPQKEVPVVPPGYSYVYGTYNITTNGTVDISSYASAYVNVPAPEGWILPSGYAFITSNGNFDIREFESVNVNVPQGGAAVLGNLSVNENGQYSASSYSYDGFDVVNVNVPQPTMGGVTITSNGIYSASDFGYNGLSSAIVNVPVPTYVFGYQNITTNGTTYASTFGYDGFTYVNVNVPTGGGSTPTLSVSGQYGMYQGKYYIYDTNLMTYLTLTGPIANVGLGDTVSGTVEYSDIDGTGMTGTYICKNFSGTNTKDPSRVYTSLSVNNYYQNTAMIVSTVSGGISPIYYSLDVGESKTTYYLPGDYSGSTIEGDSTVYCYVSKGYPMMILDQYWINEVVNVVAPVLTGASYSTDGGMTWNTMSSDAMINGYSADNLGRSISSMSGDHLSIRLEYDNGASYKYVTNYVSIDSGSMNPYSNTISKDPMMLSFTIYNNATFNIEVSKISVTNNTIYVYWTQGVSYSYRIVTTDSNGTPTGNKYAMQNDPALGWKYNNWDNENIEYFYIEKFIVGQSTGVEEYKPSETVTMDDVMSYSVSTTGTGLLHLVESAKNQIIFNVNNMSVRYNRMDYISLKDSNGMEICKVYHMDVGTTFNNANSVSGCYFTDSGGAINYKPSENISISSTYDGNITVNHDNTGTISFDAGNYNLYYWDAAVGNEKGVFIHGITTP